VSAVAGGVAGYGTGALMPLVLVPLVGAAPVVPIIAISAMFTIPRASPRFAARSIAGARSSRFLQRCRPASSAPGSIRF